MTAFFARVKYFWHFFLLLDYSRWPWSFTTVTPYWLNLFQFLKTIKWIGFTCKIVPVPVLNLWLFFPSRIRVFLSKLMFPLGTFISCVDFDCFPLEFAHFAWKMIFFAFFICFTWEMIFSLVISFFHLENEYCHKNGIISLKIYRSKRNVRPGDRTFLFLKSLISKAKKHFR